MNWTEEYYEIDQDINEFRILNSKLLPKEVLIAVGRHLRYQVVHKNCEVFHQGNILYKYPFQLFEKRQKIWDSIMFINILFL